MKPTMRAPGTKLVKLEYDKLISNFAFKFNLRRYTTAVIRLRARLGPDVSLMCSHKAGCCQLYA